MPANEQAVLRVYGQGEFTVHRVNSFLKAMIGSYESFLFFDGFLDMASHQRHRLKPWFEFGYLPYPVMLGARGLPTLSEISRFVATKDRLRIRSIQLSSPGFWDFAGRLNPLEVIRQFLHDRHERRKDREYRERSERERLNLENQKLALENSLLENQVIRERINMAREIGVSPQALIGLQNELIFKPLHRLGRSQEDGLVSDAEIKLLGDK